MAPNDEFIREVDEEYRRDQVAQIWKRYNGLIIGAAVLLVARCRRLALLAARPGDQRPGGGRPLRGRAAALPRGQDDEAEKALEALAKDRPPATRCSRGSASQPSSDDKERRGGRHGLRRLGARRQRRAALAGPRPPARRHAAHGHGRSRRPCARRSSGLRPPTKTWRHTARELLGLSGLKAGDMDSPAAGSTRSPPIGRRRTALRQRLAVYTALVAGGPVQATQ